MSLISEDLMINSQHKAKSFSREFLQRYLNGIADFVKTDLDTVRLFADVKPEERDDFTCQIFSLWKFMLQNLDHKNGDALSLVYTFILHLHVSYL